MSEVEWVVFWMSFKFGVILMAPVAIHWFFRNILAGEYD